jgi:hypothetical protein
MTVTLQERQKFYVELIKNPSGYQDKLKNNVSFEEDTEGTKFSRLYKELGAVGIIKNGIDGTLKRRYKVTSLGQEQINSFVKIYSL